MHGLINGLVGYNNSSFDDHFLLQHLKKKLDPETFILVRRKVFTVDIHKALKLKGTLSKVFSECGGTSEDQAKLHDALQDCRALARVLHSRRVKIGTLQQSCRSAESIQSKRTNPLLKANLITEGVAEKLGRQFTCSAWIAMSDEQIIEILQAAGVKSASIKICLKKRLLYIDSAS